MKQYSSIGNRKYMKICRDSGCISANYNADGNDGEITVITYESNNSSGNFKYSKSKNNEHLHRNVH